MISKQRVLLQVDVLSNKVYDIKTYHGDGEGIDYEVDNLNILTDAEKEGQDIYYINGSLVKKPKDKNEYHNRLTVLQREIKELKDKERKIFAEYSLGQRGSTAGKRLIELSVALNEKRNEIEELKKFRLSEIKKVVNKKLNNASFKYYCSICLIIRDDNEYLEEWLEWHIKQGIEHFYIYDHGSKQPVSEFISTLSQEIQDKVTVINFGLNHDFAQHDAYNDCLRNYGIESRWIGFIDSDEMVRVKERKIIPDFLKEFEDYAGLFIGWILYGAEGQVSKSKEAVRERFTVPVVGENNNQKGVGKVFIQPLYMKQMLTHNGYPIEGYKIVDESHGFVENGIAWKMDLPTERICIDHYYTKSYEEWVEKIKRGSCDRYYSRRYKEFFIINPDMEYCKEEEIPIQEYEVSKK